MTPPTTNPVTHRSSAPRVAIVFDCLFPATSGGGERVYRRMAEEFANRNLAVDYVTRELAPTGPEPFRVVPVWRGDIYDNAGGRTTSSAVRFALGVYRHLRRNRNDYDVIVASALPVLTLLAARLALRGRRETRAYLVADWLEVWTWHKWRAYAGVLTGTVAFVLQAAAARAGDLNTVNSQFTAARLGGHSGSDPVVLGLVDLVEEGAGVPVARRAGVVAQDGVAAASAGPVILFVGRHIPDKRVHTLPAALREVQRSRPNVTAIVVGTGPETPRLEREVERSDVAEAVELAGRVSDERLAELFSGAAVLVNPSAREGFGLVVAEAAAHGTPSVIVAGEDNAAVDLIAEGVNGFVVASAEPAVLAAGILAAIEGGESLRRSTFEWYQRERIERSLGGSVDEILARYLAARSSD